MGILSNILGDATAKPIEAIGNVVDKFVNGDENRELAKAALQIEINKIEAANQSLFVSGARPFILWVCGFSLACYFIPQYIMGAYLWVKMCLATQTLQPYPLDTRGLMELVYSLLGLGILRSVDKVLKK